MRDFEKNPEILDEFRDYEDNLSAFLPEQNNIWVPPDVDVRGAYLFFPPEPPKEEFSIEMEQEDEEGRLTLIPVTYESNVHFYNSKGALLSWFSRNGWKNRKDTKGVLQEFIKLADKKPGVEWIKNKARVYQQFAKKWGPLWVGCLPSKENGDKSIEQSFYKRDGWYGYELLGVWHDTARRVAAVFYLASALNNKEAGKSKHWAELGLNDVVMDFSPEIRYQYLLGVVNNHLRSVPQLQVVYKEDKPVLEINSGLGFLNAVWLQVAMLLTQTSGLYICDSCGLPYVRKLRKPAKGKRNFCGECSKGGKGYKRLWARKKANKQAWP